MWQFSKYFTFFWKNSLSFALGLFMGSMKSIDFRFSPSFCGPFWANAAFYWRYNINWWSCLFIHYNFFTFTKCCFSGGQMDDSSKLIEMIFSFVLAFWTFIFLFLVCEPGHQVTEAYAQYEQELVQCNWHLLPTITKRLYLMFLLDAQQPINIQCYGGVLCARDIFKNVCSLWRFWKGPSKDNRNSYFFR